MADDATGTGGGAFGPDEPAAPRPADQPSPHGPPPYPPGPGYGGYPGPHPAYGYDAPSPYQQPYHYGPGPFFAPSPNGKAISSLVLGIVGIFMIPVLASIPGVVLGVIARREIRDEPQRYTGDGLALAGLITSAVGLALWLAFFVIVVAIGVGFAAS